MRCLAPPVPKFLSNRHDRLMIQGLQSTWEHNFLFHLDMLCIKLLELSRLGQQSLLLIWPQYARGEPRCVEPIHRFMQVCGMLVVVLQAVQCFQFA